MTANKQETAMHSPITDALLKPLHGVDTRSVNSFEWNKIIVHARRMESDRAALMEALERYCDGHPCEGGDICPTNREARAALKQAKGG